MATQEFFRASSDPPPRSRGMNQNTSWEPTPREILERCLAVHLDAIANGAEPNGRRNAMAEIRRQLKQLS